MKEYSGSVLFVDLLGFGYLTDNPESIEADDFRAHRFQAGNGSNQLFSAYILAKFRKHLMLLRDESQNIKVAQLSDWVELGFIATMSASERALAASADYREC